MISKKISVEENIKNRKDIVSNLVQIACGYKSDIEIEAGNKKINAKSLFGAMQVDMKQYDTVKIIADGVDENEAINVIEDYFTKIKKDTE